MSLCLDFPPAAEMGQHGGSTARADVDMMDSDEVSEDDQTRSMK